jgi:hypothetical protein
MLHQAHPKWHMFFNVKIKENAPILYSFQDEIGGQNI